MFYFVLICGLWWAPIFISPWNDNNPVATSC